MHSITEILREENFPTMKALIGLADRHILKYQRIGPFMGRKVICRASTSIASHRVTLGESLLCRELISKVLSNSKALHDLRKYKNALLNFISHHKHKTKQIQKYRNKRLASIFPAPLSPPHVLNL